MNSRKIAVFPKPFQKLTPKMVAEKFWLRNKIALYDFSENFESRGIGLLDIRIPKTGAKKFFLRF